jgi:Fe2+ transport system protein B
MKSAKKRKSGDNPYLSSAQKAEREEFEQRRRRIMLMVIVGIPVGLVVLYLLYLVTTPPVYVD